MMGGYADNLLLKCIQVSNVFVYDHEGVSIFSSLPVKHQQDSVFEIHTLSLFYPLSNCN